MPLLACLTALGAVAPLSPPAAPALLAVDSLIIGQRVGGKWRPVDHRFAPTLRRTAFYRVGIGSVGATLWVPGAGGEEATGGSYLDRGERFVRDVAVSGLRPSVPRKVQTFPTNSSIYRAVVDRYLRRQGMRVSSPRLTRVVGVDLDGDGTREMIIEAQSREGLGRSLPGGGSGPNRWSPRDYSLVLLRWVRQGRPQELALAFTRGSRGESDPGGGIEEIRLRAVADLDGDGRMEIVVGTEYYEGSGALLYGFRRGVAQKLLSNGAGV